MIRYDLRCAGGHDFEAWFASSAAFDRQAEAGLVTCALCGSADVAKALMAPRLTARGNKAKTGGAAPAGPAAPMAAPGPAEKMRRMLEALRKEVETNSEYVGGRFAAEARSMHLGEVEQRAIHGEATREEAKSLIEDGVPVTPLPFLPRRNG